MTDGDAGTAEPLAFETGELTDLGEENRLVLMAVDPLLLYAYWNITPKRMEAARALFEDGEIEGHVLRFHDATGVDFDGVNSRGSFDVSIHIDDRKWYVHLWSPEKRYCADIGVRGKDGRLVALVRSNMVETSAAWPRVKVDESAALVEQGAPDAAPVAAAPHGDSHEVLEMKIEELAALRDEPLPPASGAAPQPSWNGSDFSLGVSSVLLGRHRKAP
jgi:hypothetical protein